MAKTSSVSQLAANGDHSATERPNPPSGFVALSLLLRADPKNMPDPNDGGPCHLCTARCCKYFALPIDTPSTLEDYDQIRWYLMHEGVAVWMDDGDWYIEIRTVCKHLQPDNSCGIYETRPQICRDYGTAKEGPCEFFTEDLKYELYFDSDQDLETWLSHAQDHQEDRKQRRKARRKKRFAGLH